MRELGSMYDKEPATWKEILEDFNIVMPKGTKRMSNLREEIEKIAWLLAGSLVDPKITVEQATDQIITLLDKEIQKARLDEMNRMLEKLKSGEWKSFATEVTDRIKQLEKGNK